MANHFQDSFNRPQQPNMFEAFNAFRQNPSEFLAKNGINVPQEYANNPEMMGKYLLSNMPQMQQNKIFQTVNMLRGMFGGR